MQIRLEKVSKLTLQIILGLFPEEMGSNENLKLEQHFTNNVIFFYLQQHLSAQHDLSVYKTH